jgi:hypothetical protein
MSYGIIEYNSEGLPMCEICGEFFARVTSHVRQKHNMTAREYKLKFGFDLIKGITSQESREKSRNVAYDNYEQCIANNLLHNGGSTRFKPGHKGRTRDKVSEQTRIELVERAKNSMALEHRRELCRKLGKSGKGNKARHNR